MFSSNDEVIAIPPIHKKSIDYVLSSTKKNFNEWVAAKVNVKEHFKDFHFNLKK